MNPRRRGQVRTTTSLICRSFGPTRLKALAFAALVASTVSMAGCQQMGFRSRNEELKQMIEEQDDWALPLSGSNRAPRPNVGEIMAQRRSEAAKRRSLESNGDTNSIATELPKTTNNTPKIAQADTESEASKSNAIPSTNINDIDVESALATLPPGYRDILKKQLDVAQRQAKAAPRESRLLSDQEPETAVATKSKDADSNTNESLIAARKEPKEKSSGKVSAKISDSNPDEVVVLASGTSKTDANEHPVTNALAVSQTTSNKVDANGSHIEKASSTSPLHATPPLPGNASPNNVPPNQYGSPASPATWSQLLGQAIELLEKKIKENPAADENLRISDEVTLRTLYLSQRRLNDATREIDVLSEKEQDYFRYQMQALYEAGNPDAMPVRSRRWSLVMNPQREATNLLAAISNLEVKSAAFCTQVEGYGVITKFPRYQFKPDEELLLYCEIENVAASKVKDGYESQLQGSYEIIDAQGRKIADQLLPIESEICQNHRRDYFIVYKIFMPQQIAPGNYQLRLTVEDTKARKFGQSNLDFQIKK